MLQELSFTAMEDGTFISAAIQVTSDVGIHLEFPAQARRPRSENRVSIEQSMTGDGFVECHTEYSVGQLYDKAVEGVIPGMYLRVRVSSESMPASGHILM